MEKAKHTLNELLVELFNTILYIEERNLKNNGVTLGMSEIHLLEAINKVSDNSMTYIANRIRITQGTLTSNAKRLINKGYVERYKDLKDKRVVRLRLTEKAYPVLAIHDDFHEKMIDKTIQDLHINDNVVLIDSLDRIMKYFNEEYQVYSEKNEGNEDNS